MSIAAVAHEYIYGINYNINSNALFSTNDEILFVTGTCIIRYDINKKKQFFLMGSQECIEISALCISNNKRFLTFAEITDTIIHIVVYDLRLMVIVKNIPLEKLPKNTRVMIIRFSDDDKYLYIQTGAPDWKIYQYKLDKAVLTMVINNMPPSYHPNLLDDPNYNDNDYLYEMSINKDPKFLVSVVGKGYLRVFSFKKGSYDYIDISRPDKPTEYLCHCWLNNYLLMAGSKEGRVDVFNFSGTFISSLDNAHDTIETDDNPVNSICTLKEGFALTGKNIVTIYKLNSLGSFDIKSDSIKELNTNKVMFSSNNYKILKKLKLTNDNTINVSGLVKNQSEDELVCYASNNQLFFIDLYKCEESALNDLDEGGNEDNHYLFSQLSLSYHTQGISALDICARKSLIATCSKDHSLRIWNYIDNNVELIKYFQEEAYCLSIHPSGLYIIVGFNDKLRFMNILVDDIRTFKEFNIRNCRECKFSNGGQYFAAVCGNDIHVYSTWSFELLTVMTGHNGKINSVKWSKDDTKMVSCGKDGAVYLWSVENSSKRREGEHVLKNCDYTCAVLAHNNSSIYVVGSDKALKEIEDSQVTREMNTKEVYTQIILSNSGKMLFAGTSRGTIRAIRYPFNSITEVEYREHKAHSKAVTALQISCDDKYLFSAGEDGNIFIFQINEREDKHKINISYGNEMLITKTELEEKISKIIELKTRLEELKLERDYQLRNNDVDFNKEQNTLIKEHRGKLEYLNNENKNLKNLIEYEREKHEEKFAKEIENYEKTIQELESLNNYKLMSKYKKYEQLERELAKIQSKWEKEVKELNSKNFAELEKISMSNDKILNEKEEDINSLKERLYKQNKENDEIMIQTKEDSEIEIENIKKKYDDIIKGQKETAAYMKGENGIMKKKFTSFYAEIETHKAELERIQAECRRLKDIISKMEKNIASVNREILVREEMVHDKEKNIFDLKKENQELEKYKYVLDYKIKELKTQIEPREHEIDEISEKIIELDEDLQIFKKKNQNFEESIEEIKEKIKNLIRMIDKEKVTIRSYLSIVTKFRVSLNCLVNVILEPKLLKKTFEKIYKQFLEYVKDLEEEDKMDENTKMEILRQQNTMMRQIKKYKGQIIEEEKQSNKELTSMLNNNIDLISELSNLLCQVKIERLRYTNTQRTLKRVMLIAQQVEKRENNMHKYKQYYV
ncbi:WD40 repeat-like protein [Piromyces finnis]|uniref:WD40 repeat-like protein n=1 Tax=Piromyces finnis TaxID=1754191 RepID=A0A1Y1V1J3_9FUNG|nr:WD40 repeat-like protein [Piromyces finnis]|eukprot:ORX44505.1 WD40 repeat-like protein [Piromyces finnis]